MDSEQWAQAITAAAGAISLVIGAVWKHRRRQRDVPEWLPSERPPWWRSLRPPAWSRRPPSRWDAPPSPVESDAPTPPRGTSTGPYRYPVPPRRERVRRGVPRRGEPDVPDEDD